MRLVVLRLTLAIEALAAMALRVGLLVLQSALATGAPATLAVRRTSLLLATPARRERSAPLGGLGRRRGLHSRLDTQLLQQFQQLPRGVPHHVAADSVWVVQHEPPQTHLQ